MATALTILLDNSKAFCMQKITNKSRYNDLKTSFPRLTLLKPNILSGKHPVLLMKGVLADILL